MVRADIPLASVKQLLKDGGADRVGDAAAKGVVLQVNRLLVIVAKRAAASLKLAKRQTLNLAHLLNAAEGVTCKGINMNAVSSASHQKGKRSSLPMAAVVRVFKAAMGEGFRVDEEAKYGLVVLAESYALAVGGLASKVCEVAGRVTVNVADVELAAGQLMN